MDNFIVTTAHDPLPEMEITAHRLAGQFQTRYVPRGNQSLAVLKAEHCVSHVLLVTRRQLVLDTPGGEYFFHLNLAKMRIKNLQAGKHDHMIDAMALAPGDTVLDCTLGLASDAVVASFHTGTSGRVVGLEVVPVVAEITRRGLAAYDPEEPEIKAAMARITVINTGYQDYLPGLPDKSFDIVYFDPMFRRPVKASSSMAPLRFLADHMPVPPVMVKEAIRVARKRVVIKEARQSEEFARLGFNRRVGGKYASIAYAYLDARGVEG